MKIVVPDASVLLKWVVPTTEEGRDRALQLREAAVAGEITLMVPSLWLYEVGNTLARRFPDQAGQLLEVLVAFGLIERGATDPWRRQVLKLTRDYGVTFYDAAYHALAAVESGIFVTADSEYVLRTRAAGAVSLLGDYPSQPGP
ncbi:MAG: type II toxin-antitoxin system VapC family toxin [Betaproteobacteria bacterium]|nr:type II toxin-antitoxin system VapC family toxin [Betaproteobacteria bacterium]